MAASVQTARPKAPRGAHDGLGSSALLWDFEITETTGGLRPAGLADPEKDWLWQGRRALGPGESP